MPATPQRRQEAKGTCGIGSDLGDRGGIASAMQIGRIELRKVVKSRNVRKGHNPALLGHQPLRPQHLQSAIDVNGGEAKRIGDLLLDERHVEAALGIVRVIAETHAQLTEKVSDTLFRRLTSKAQRPLAQDRIFYKR